MIRKDGRFEMREVEVEGSYLPHAHNNVSAWDSNRKFVDDYLV